MQSPLKDLDRIIATALEEDIGKGDITSNSVIAADAMAEFYFVNRDAIIACGFFVVRAVFKALDPEVKVRFLLEEGDSVSSDTALIHIKGNARSILAGERVALNLFQHMCGIATYTKKYVNLVEGTNARILDTRKTIPGLRELEKYAVRMGGGYNNRKGLDDGVLIKDNHISICGGITEAIRRARMTLSNKIRIQVECDTLDQVRQALAAGADMLLLDNMSSRILQEAVHYVKGRIPLEASGGVNMKNVRKIAETGVDYISIGALTHSAPNADIGLDGVGKIY